MRVSLAAIGIAAIAVALVAGGCGGGGGGGGLRVKVTGAVRDLEGNGIANATVAVGTGADETDAQGVFEIEDFRVPARNVQVVITVQGQDLAIYGVEGNDPEAEIVDIDGDALTIIYNLGIPAGRKTLNIGTIHLGPGAPTPP